MKKKVENKEEKDKRPRGVRNCNPGNIRKNSDHFQGEVDSTDPDFKQFRSMAYGYRAIFKILRTYKNNYSLNTLRQMIYRWAPPGVDKNDPESYTKFVSERAGISGDHIVDVSNMTIMCRIVEAMATMECKTKKGWVPDMNEVRDGWMLL